MVGFFKLDLERLAARKETKITSFFRKEGEIENAFYKGKAQYGAVCDKILMKSKASLLKSNK